MTHTPSAVVTATCLLVRWNGFHGDEDSVRTSHRTTKGTGSFPGVKRPGRGVDHPPHLAPRLKKEYSYISTPPSGPSSIVLGWTLPLPQTEHCSLWGTNWMIYKLGNVNNEINTDSVTTGLQRPVSFESLRCTSMSTTPLCLPNVSNISVRF